MRFQLVNKLATFTLSVDGLVHEHPVKPLGLSALNDIKPTLCVVGHQFVQLRVRVEAECLESESKGTLLREIQ